MSNKFLQAHSVAAGRCQNPTCKSLHIQFYDQNYEIIAMAVVDRDLAHQFVSDCNEALIELSQIKLN